MHLELFRPFLIIERQELYNEVLRDRRQTIILTDTRLTHAVVICVIIASSSNSQSFLSSLLIIVILVHD